MLDCLTPLGQEAINEQYRVQSILEGRGYTVINTNGDDHHSDVLLAKRIDNRLIITGVAEIKSRKYAGATPLTMEYLSNNGGYLITEHKLEFGKNASSIYNVPFFVIVSLMLENKILVWQITNSKGQYVGDITKRVTSTRKTVNGGKIERLNAFLPMNSKYLTVIE